MPENLDGGFSAFIFDLDGTLLDSMGVWDKIDRLWLSENKVAPGEGLLSVFKSMDFAAAAAFSKNELGIDKEESEMIDEWERLAMLYYSEKIPLKPGALRLLKKLFEKGRPIALVTACRESLCRAALSRHGISPLFSQIVFGSKESPDIYLKTAALLGVSPKSCLVFDDNYRALLSAKKAGMATVAVYDLSSEADNERIKAEADFYIDGFNSLF